MDNLLFSYSCMAVHGGCRINQILVVRSDNISHILCAAGAYLHIIPIEIFMKLVRMWKV